MAQDSGHSKGQIESDVDIGVDVLILAKYSNSLKITMQYMTRKGCPTRVVNTISGALEAIAAKRPDIFLISFNHPHPAVHRLPDLISQTFDVTCVGFVELTDNLSSIKLSSLKIRHKIFGTPSGPNILRGVRRVIKERYSIKTEFARELREKSGQQVRQAPPRTTIALGTVAGSSLTGSSLAMAPDMVGMLKRSLFGEEEEVVETRVELEPFPGLMEDSIEDAAGTPQEHLEHATEAAIERFCAQNPNMCAVALGKVSRFAVFPVVLNSMPGYLVLAIHVPGDEDIVRVFKSCELDLQNSLNRSGIKAKVETGFWLDMPNVDFEVWARESALFNFKIVHQGQDLGVAYMRSDKPLVVPQPSEDRKMFTVGVDQLSTEEPVNFKAYLYLPENDKYYLYLRNGRKLQPEQKKRLEDKNIKQVFIKSLDLENLRMFMAASAIKTKIKKPNAA
jgi:hypothetical protein